MLIEKGPWGSITRHPDEEISDTAESIQTVLKWTGDYAVCKSMAPARGSAVSGYDGVVTSVNIERGAGNKGTLTVTVTRANSIGGTPSIVSESHELRWMEIQKALITHPRYTEFNSGYGAATLYTMSESFSTTNPDYAGMTLGEVAKACEAANPKDRQAILDAASVGAQADFIRDYLANLATGSDSYKYFVPALTSRYNYTSRPTGTGAGYISAAPTGHPLYGSIGATGLVWFKDADDVTYSGPQGGYERTQTWIGLDSINTNLYKNG